MHRSKRYYRHLRCFLLFLLPSLLIYTIFWIVPIIFNGVISFSPWNGVTAFSDIKWVGFQNFKNIFTNDIMFPQALWHNVVFTVISVIFVPLVGLILATLIEKATVHKGIYRTLLFVPAVVPLMAVAILFRWVYSIDGGIINELLALVGLGSLQRDFLGDSATALYAVSVINIWKALPFYMTILLSGLQSIPHDLEEAAEIDGCTKMQAIRHVTIPLLKPILVVVYGLVIIDGFRTFDLIFVTTNGGPNFSTEILTTYIYRVAFGDFRMGYATALSMVNIIIVLIITMIYFRFSMKSNTD